MVATKTSLTHPLTIPRVAVPGGGFIGMTMCPGKCQPLAITGPWQRDLTLDMQAIVDTGAAILVTLMETDELVAAAVSTQILKDAAAAHGLDWLHLPIKDFQAPDAAFESAWINQYPALRTALAGGKTIVAHCRGGRGRSGTFAARVLVNAGLPPLEAIAAVRTANPYAIETQVQEAYVLALGEARKSPSTR